MAGLGTVAARLARVLAAVGPPIAVVGVWRDVVMNHPVLAVILLGMYEILVAVLLFAGKIAAELRERWQKRIVNRLDRALGQRSPDSTSTIGSSCWPVCASSISRAWRRSVPTTPSWTRSLST
ncbi:MAG: hypothetical protein ACRDRU_25085 [Pseudonocardiaceae bacterium]